MFYLRFLLAGAFLFFASVFFRATAFLFGAFFTATSMIGLIALAGIMVRNSVLLIDFIEARLREGSDLAAACVDRGVCVCAPLRETGARLGALVGQPGARLGALVGERLSRPGGVAVALDVQLPGPAIRLAHGPNRGRVGSSVA